MQLTWAELTGEFEIRWRENWKYNPTAADERKITANNTAITQQQDWLLQLTVTAQWSQYEFQVNLLNNRQK